LALKSNEKSLTTHHTEKNSMASPTQMVVGKGIPNLLIVEDLLKILRDPIPPSAPKFLTNSRPLDGKTTKKSCNYFSSEIITDQTCYVNIIPLAYPAVRLTLY